MSPGMNRTARKTSTVNMNSVGIISNRRLMMYALTSHASSFNEKGSREPRPEANSLPAPFLLQTHFRSKLTPKQA